MNHPNLPSPAPWESYYGFEFPIDSFARPDDVAIAARRFLDRLEADLSNVSFAFQFQSRGLLHCRFQDDRDQTTLLCPGPRAVYQTIRESLVSLDPSATPPPFEEYDVASILDSEQRIFTLLKNVGSGISWLLHSDWFNRGSKTEPAEEVRAAARHIEKQFEGLRTWIEKQIATGSIAEALKSRDRQKKSVERRG